MSEFRLAPSSFVLPSSAAAAFVLTTALGAILLSLPHKNTTPLLLMHESFKRHRAMLVFRFDTINDADKAALDDSDDDDDDVVTTESKSFEGI